jgi:hypothetical protein
MPDRCNVFGCRSNYDAPKGSKEKPAHVKIISIKPTSEFREAWLAALPKRDGFDTTGTIHVCTLHWKGYPNIPTVRMKATESARHVFKRTFVMRSIKVRTEPP